jgi:sialate O-acetylesterase
MNKRAAFITTTCLLSLFLYSAALADLRLPSFFSDNMVLQRDKPVSIWGWAEPKTEVHVLLHGKLEKTMADEQGTWRVALPAMKANSEGANLVIENQSDRLEIKNVLIGEVWFASGQSNMAFVLKNSQDATEDIAAAKHPGIRMFLATNTPASEPQSDIEGSWSVCTPETAGSFSAVAYFFAKKIHEETGLPVGIIKSCWGGKRCECYTSREAMLSNEHGKKMIAELDEQSAKFDSAGAKEKYQVQLEKWQKQSAQIRAENKGKEKSAQKRIPRRPQPPKAPNRNEGNPTVLYNGMIHPFVGYTMRGAIWYQGEANCRTNLAPIYQEMFTLMIEDWRARWNDDFAFYFVQLANFKKPTVEPGIDSEWATVQNQQRLTLELPGTGMATINDVGAANDIHPKDKKTVGQRLARWALKNQYGQNVVVSGPLFESTKLEGDRAIVKFTHLGNGLSTRDGKSPQRFELAGADKKWHWATAKIEGDSVVCTSPAVPKPVAVRYAWAANPEGANLINSEGLPASLFRSDDWPASFETAN